MKKSIRRENEPLALWGVSISWAYIGGALAIGLFIDALVAFIQDLKV